MTPVCRENRMATHTGTAVVASCCCETPGSSRRPTRSACAIDPHAASAASKLSAVSIYPEARVYGTDLKPGDTLNVPLAPTRPWCCLSTRPRPPASVPAASKIDPPSDRRRGGEQRVSLEKFTGNADVLGTHSTCSPETPPRAST